MAWLHCAEFPCILAGTRNGIPHWSKAETAKSPFIRRRRAALSDLKLLRLNGERKVFLIKELRHALVVVATSGGASRPKCCEAGIESETRAVRRLAEGHGHREFAGSICLARPVPLRYTPAAADSARASRVSLGSLENLPIGFVGMSGKVLQRQFGLLESKVAVPNSVAHPGLGAGYESNGFRAGVRIWTPRCSRRVGRSASWRKPPAAGSRSPERSIDRLVVRLGGRPAAGDDGGSPAACDSRLPH